MHLLPALMLQEMQLLHGEGMRLQMPQLRVAGVLLLPECLLSQGLPTVLLRRKLACTTATQTYSRAHSATNCNFVRVFCGGPH